MLRTPCPQRGGCFKLSDFHLVIPRSVFVKYGNQTFFGLGDSSLCMNTSLRYSSLAIVALGCGTLIIPLLTLPYPIFPPLIGVLPYSIIVPAILLAHTRSEHFTVLAVSSLVSFVGGYLYLDPIFFNHLFLWDSVGLVAKFLPAFAIAPALSLLIILSARRLRTAWRFFSAYHRRGLPPPTR